MKLTTKTLKEIVLEELSAVLDENSQQLKMYGSTFSPKKFPGPPEYQEKIDKLLDFGDPEKFEVAMMLMTSFGATEEEFIDYASSREKAMKLDKDPALYSSNLSAKQVKEKINKVISEPGVKIYVRSFADTQHASLAGSGNYDLLVTLEVGIAGYFMDQDQKAEKYKKVKRNLPLEQVEKIENVKKKLANIFSSAGYKLEDGSINFGGGEKIEGFWPSKQDMSKFSGIYQVNAKEAKPIEI